VAQQDPEVSEADMPRNPPTSAADSLSKLAVRPGFRMEVVAAEPLVVDPVAMAFDERGRLFVVEMRDYSERRDERLGRVRLLTDSDGDGVYDQSVVYAEGLPWPTALHPWDGGLFVASTPDLIYFKDADGDGRAEQRKVVFTGFGSANPQLNVQQLINSFHWTLDNRIHGSTAGNGGVVRRADDPNAAPVELGGRDFSFDPVALDLRPEIGGGQHGVGFDDYGRKFVTSNSSHIQQVVYGREDLAAMAAVGLGGATVEIPVDGPAAPVFRRSADEPWRVIRTQWRVTGLVAGPIEGGGKPSGYFTGATGVTPYRGDVWPAEYLGDAFVADCGSNLIHRKKVRTGGVRFVAERAPDELASEFAASTDNWFRPVQFANAPDGTLMVLDMYREVIEHPWSIPPNLKRLIDLNSGNDRGRIYRIAPEGFQTRGMTGPGEASTAELVRLLGHANGWHRDTASRLLHARRDRAAIPALERLAGESGNPRGQTHALWALWDLRALRLGHLEAAAASGEAGLRENVARLLGHWWAEAGTPGGKAPGLMARLLGDPHPRVRFQAALVLARGGMAVDWNWLGPLAGRAVDSWDVGAALAVARLDPLAALAALASHEGPLPPGLWGGLGGQLRGEAVGKGMSLALGKSARLDTAGLLILAGACLGGERGLDLVPEAERAGLLERARGALAAADGQPAEALAAAVRLLRFSSAENLLAAIRETRREAIRGPVEGAVVSAALDSLGERGVGLLLEFWDGLSPQGRAQVFDRAAQAGREGLSRALFDGIESGKIAPSQLSLAHKNRFRAHADMGLRARAIALFGAVSEGTREEALARNRPALGLAGEAGRGRAIYEERCASCHRLDGAGSAVGPDLESVRSAGKESLFLNLLDPNREVAARFRAVEVEARGEEPFAGVVAQETEGILVLRGAGGVERTFEKAALVSRKESERSLMPEGLEAGLNLQELADLMAFVLGGR